MESNNRRVFFTNSYESAMGPSSNQTRVFDELMSRVASRISEVQEQVANTQQDEETLLQSDKEYHLLVKVLSLSGETNQELNKFFKELNDGFLSKKMCDLLFRLLFQFFAKGTVDSIEMQKIEYIQSEILSNLNEFSTHFAAWLKCNEKNNVMDPNSMNLCYNKVKAIIVILFIFTGEMFRNYFKILLNYLREGNYKDEENADSEREAKNIYNNILLFKPSFENQTKVEIYVLYLLRHSQKWLEPVVNLMEKVMGIFRTVNFRSMFNESDNAFLTNIYTLNKVFYISTLYSSIQDENSLFRDVLKVTSTYSLVSRFFNVYKCFYMPKSRPQPMVTTDLEKTAWTLNTVGCFCKYLFEDTTFGVDFTQYFSSSLHFLKTMLEATTTYLFKALDCFTTSPLPLDSFFVHLNISPNLNLFQNLQLHLQKFCVYWMISAFNKDVLNDAITSSKGLYPILALYVLNRTVIKMLSLNKTLETSHLTGKEEIAGEFVFRLMSDLLEDFNGKVSTKLPFRCVAYKMYLLQCYVVVLHYLTKKFHSVIMRLSVDKLDIIRGKMKVFRELIKMQNPFFFKFGTEIMMSLGLRMNDKEEDTDNTQVKSGFGESFKTNLFPESSPVYFSKTKEPNNSESFNNSDVPSLRVVLDSEYTYFDLPRKIIDNPQFAEEKGDKDQTVNDDEMNMDDKENESSNNENQCKFKFVSYENENGSKHRPRKVYEKMAVFDITDVKPFMSTRTLTTMNLSLFLVEENKVICKIPKLFQKSHIITNKGEGTDKEIEDCEEDFLKALAYTENLGECGNPECISCILNGFNENSLSDKNIERFSYIVDVSTEMNYFEAVNNFQKIMI